MCLFISINFDDKTKEIILEVQRRLKNLGKGRFISPENLHLTLAFLGEVPEERVPALKEIMDSVDVPGMTLTFSEIGAFRNESELWWIGITKNDQLSALQAELTRKLKDAGFSVGSKKFKPHITLAREMNIGRVKRSELLSKDFNCSVSHVSLMLSHRPNGKLTYTELHRR